MSDAREKVLIGIIQDINLVLGLDKNADIPIKPKKKKTKRKILIPIIAAEALKTGAQYETEKR